MKILFLSAEVAPFAKVGGLSQVMYFLPQALRKHHVDVRLFTPKYGEMRDSAWKLKMLVKGLTVPPGENNSRDDLICNVKVATQADTKVTTYFLENREYYELRANVYGYKDDHIRFLLMCKGCLEWLKLSEEQAKKEGGGWFPEIIHCHDWQAGYLIDLARRDPRYMNMFKNVKMVYTVHNLAYQGNYDFRFSGDAKTDNGKRPLRYMFDPKLQKQNPLLRGILNADLVTTVSPTHAKEVMTADYAEGLEKYLNRLKKPIIGIMNGLGESEFDPEKDVSIYKNFNTKNFSAARRDNKKDIQTIFKLPLDPKAFVINITGRVVPQKGWDLLLEVLPNLLREKEETQIIVMGKADEYYGHRLQQLQKQFPHQLSLHLRTNFDLPHKLFAGSDVTLMPSAYEPGGIVALEAMRYGSVPIVRRTGGLNDAILDFDASTGVGNGFSFSEKTQWSLYGAIIEALAVYKQQNLWHTLVRNCLEYDSSWRHAAKEYLRTYRRILV